ncbi:3D domain-containing protein [Candidatus Nomurabacteria bacterium]|nr:3D domain-containing protein [Candidatus Nomurabacteria bacterium]
MNFTQNQGKLNKTVILGTILAILVIFDFPQAVFSQSETSANTGPRAENVLKSHYGEPTLPESGDRLAKTTMNIIVTSYNSEPGQTDDSPFITAFNTHVRDGIVATNFLPKGTLVRFPDEFGDKIFVVEDRMNSRYYYRMDIWMADKAESIKFGAKYLKMEIL